MHPTMMPTYRSFVFPSREPDPTRGEIAAHIGGRRHILCLTLGALAEIEARISDVTGLPDRLKSGNIAVAELAAVIGAGLRGGGNDYSDETVSRLEITGGLNGALTIARRLLAATFGEAE